MLGGQSDDPEAVDDDAAMLAPIALLLGPAKLAEGRSLMGRRCLGPPVVECLNYGKIFRPDRVHRWRCPGYG